MSLRVIAGTAKGMRLHPVPGDSTRPIMDRVKESLFNIIGQDIVDSVFLDLFGGTGSVGIESLSRGSHHAVFIELDRKAIKTIQKNLTHTGLDERATIVRKNAYDVVEQSPERFFHYVYVAPPQYKGIWVKILQLLDQNTHWHHDDTIIIVQIDPKEYDDTILFKNLIEYDKRKYGRTLLLFYEFMIESDEAEQQEQDID